MTGILATVLICEDEHALRELIRISLDGRYEFTQADDGRECLTIARALRPELVVLDMMLPGLNGLEVLRDLRRDPDLAAVPVLVLTAQPGTRDDAIREGANVVMEKP